MNFKEFLTNEAKRIGTVYYFVNARSIDKILNGSNIITTDLNLDIKPYELLSYNSHISTTRNFELPNYKNDLSLSKGYIFRFALNGDKISEHYKIKPLAGLTTDAPDVFNLNHNKRVKRSSGEWEEVILNVGDMNKRFNILPFIIQMDVISEDDALKDRILKSVNNKFKVNFVKKFSPVKP